MKDTNIYFEHLLENKYNTFEDLLNMTSIELCERFLGIMTPKSEPLSKCKNFIPKNIVTFI
jgi:hypothetical protein